jgi:KDO2-lipid IV(A) lauroyltransferase
MTTADVREGGRWSPAQRVKNDVIFAAAALALHATRLAPPTWLRAAGRGLGRLLHLVLRGERRRALANVARALPALAPPARAELVARTFVELGGTLAETTAALWRPAPPLPFAEADRAVLRAALAEGRGVVLPSAHLGPWERVASTLVDAGFPLTTLVRESYDRRFDAWMERLRGRAGVATIPRGGPGAASKIVRALRRGGVLGAPMDLRSRVPSAVVPFFGVPAPTAIGPARIAHRRGAPIVVASTERRDGVLALTCTRVALAEDPERTTEAINAELTRRIATAPELWPWMHPRFAETSA